MWKSIGYTEVSEKYCSKYIVFVAALMGSSQVMNASADRVTNTNTPTAESGFNTVQYEDYIDMLNQQGWDTQVYYDPNDSVRIELNKQYKGEEKHGLFGIVWENREVWNLKYIPDSSGIYMLYESNGVKKEKAPLFGEWQEITSSKELPGEIFQKKLIISPIVK